MEELLQIGIITSTHGIRGQVKVFPTTDDPRRYDDLETVLLGDQENRITMTVEAVQYFKQFVILKFKGYDSINDVEKYKGCSLYVTREQAVPLEEDEYFIADLIGLAVICEDGKNLGTVKDVLTTGANDVYVVEDQRGKEILLPAIKECILSVNLKERQIRVHIMDGLLD